MEFALLTFSIIFYRLNLFAYSFKQCLAFKRLHVFMTYQVKRKMNFFKEIIFFLISVVRSSTNKLQDVYAKVKDKSVLIRFPCNVAETIADKSLQIVVSIANPFVKPLGGSGEFSFLRVIDNFAVEKFHQIEAKYPVINMSTEVVINTLNEKTEPVRNVINTVKNTTTSTIQHGKDTVRERKISISIFIFYRLKKKRFQMLPMQQ